LQRVTRAAVRVDGELVGQIGEGVLILLGVIAGDGVGEADWLAQRAAGYRIFRDEDGRMNRSVLEVRGSALVVSQFTLAADGRKGRRPSFDRAAPPEEAEGLCERFVQRLRELGVPTETGRFGAMMEVELVNDGPVTFVLERSPTG
jgi:D-aminoacyl-tRNA deacylase